MTPMTNGSFGAVQVLPHVADEVAEQVGVQVVPAGLALVGVHSAIDDSR